MSDFLALLRDLSQPTVLLELGVALACIGLAWGLTRRCAAR